MSVGVPPSTGYNIAVFLVSSVGPVTQTETLPSGETPYGVYTACGMTLGCEEDVVVGAEKCFRPTLMVSYRTQSKLLYGRRSTVSERHTQSPIYTHNPEGSRPNWRSIVAKS